MSFLGEIRRRKVFQVAGVYLVVAWLILQVVDVVGEPLLLPDWFPRVVILLLAIGFPVALILSWAFDIGPSGVVRDRSAGSGPSTRGHRLEIALVILLVIAVGWIGFRELNPPTGGAGTLNDASVAVLPFESLSGDDEDARAFADGMHGELLAQLAGIRSITSISRTSVMQYRDTEKTIRQIGDELGVSAVLEANVQSDAGMVRLRASLVDTATDNPLWAGTLDGTLSAEGIFSIQRDMARRIVSELQATLTPDEQARLDELPTQSELAWNHYRRGDDFFWRTDFPRFTPRAVEEFQFAVREDPGFAHAWAALSRAHARMYFQNIDPTEERRDRARAALRQALDLNSRLPEAHLARGVFEYMGHRSYSTALIDLETAAQGLPNAVELYIARADILRRLGRWEESSSMYERAIELDPRWSFLHWNYGFNRVWARDYMTAESALDRAIELAPADVSPFIDRHYLPLLREGDTASMKAALDAARIDLGATGRILGWTVAIFERDYLRAIEYLNDVEVRTVVTAGRIRTPGAEGLFVRSLLYGMTYKLLEEDASAIRYFETAREEIEAALEADPLNHWLVLRRGDAAAGLGDRALAQASAVRAMSLLPITDDGVDGTVVQLGAIFVLARAGAADEAIRLLDHYLGAAGMWSIAGLETDPRLDSIRDHPGFRELVEKYGS